VQPCRSDASAQTGVSPAAPPPIRFQPLDFRCFGFLSPPGFRFRLAFAMMLPPRCRLRCRAYARRVDVSLIISLMIFRVISFSFSILYDANIFFRHEDIDIIDIAHAEGFSERLRSADAR
jgi:hypothetical protein